MFFTQSTTTASPKMMLRWSIDLYIDMGGRLMVGQRHPRDDSHDGVDRYFSWGAKTWWHLQ